MEAITAYAWIGWLVLILLFVIVEMLSLELTFLMLAIGSLGGLLSGILGAPWWLQLLIAAVIAVLLLFTIKPPLLRLLRRGGDPARSNVDALIGMGGTVVETVTRTSGLARLANGETWTARLGVAGEGGRIPAGEHVLVVSIDGATANVIPEERTAL
ncbi:NfeD family protein [Microbacterium sp. STN6]|uniref:NfeD family protein n=1 Tax=Microbacterium sp. STN6 TaxID=2995588 RepID=UPI002260AACA|nr:NfeD family protein [Microbacterium sp. STN6]MCX7521555.1 NfeD family protein [Microbacterium sp. STN6]